MGWSAYNKTRWWRRAHWETWIVKDQSGGSEVLRTGSAWTNKRAVRKAKRASGWDAAIPQGTQ